ncbi:MAG TPA: MerR family transcriptional regulator [Solirubrobacteraceae bacterium]|jgi:DNA-binding transcriptional MerR regulator
MAEDPSPLEPDDEHPLTIEQLAFESGLSVRNIRSHQARGLLPAPVVRRRVGYYGAEHLERLRAIGELQSEGLNLKAVKQLLEDADGTIERLLTLRRSIPEPVAPEQPEVLTESELSERLALAERDREKLARKLEEYGYLAPIAAGHYEVTTPALLEAIESVLACGISSSHVVDLVGSIHDHAGTVARRLTRNFLDDVWKPYVQADTPEDRWPRIADSIGRLPPLGADAMRSAFLQEIGRELDRALGKAAQELSHRKR